MTKEVANQLNYLAAAFEAEATMLEAGALAGKDSERLCPVKHSFGDGCYVREWTCPKGVVTVSKVHRIAHPFFVLKGKVSVLTESGIKLITAPYYGITPPGTKRVLYTHEETQWVTVHVTDKTEPAEIEREIISENPALQLDLAQALKQVYLETEQ
jgi:quercetin dioxygenase-like cupin family protein